MYDLVADHIEAGRVQFFACDSIDPESWSAKGQDGARRTYMMEQWYYYIVNELVPRIFEEYDCIIVESFGVGGIPDSIMDDFCRLMKQYRGGNFQCHEINEV